MTSFLTLVSLIGTLIIVHLDRSLIATINVTSPSGGDVIVEVQQGKLAGIILESREGEKYYAFRNIPYAISTRFEAPQSPKPWEGIRNASDFGPVCPQIDRVNQKVIGEENCLVLNVYTPKLTGKQAVVVFIHGGAFQFGSGNDYGSKFFADEDVILVTINYRLGALGFLNTGDDVIQGNMGLKDQVMALRWVQQNIQSFGGSPLKVTIAGTSAGGAATSLHMVSPMSKGLFHRTIAISGSALNPWSLHVNPRRTAQDLAEHLDCPREPSDALADCLRKTDFRKIVQFKLYKWYIDPLTQYAPVIETLRPGQNSSDVFLSEDPLLLLTEGRYNKVPLITGVMEDEGLLFHSAAILKNAELQRTMNEDWNYVAPITLLYDSTPQATDDQLMEISRTIRGYYFGQQTIGPETSRNLTNLYSDRYFNHGIKLAALLQAKYSPVYPFIFGFHGDWTILNLYLGDAFKEPIGVSHGDDMQYFFDSPRFPPLKENSRSEEFSKAIVKLWASFAKTGNVMESMGSPTVHWMPVSPDEIKRKKLKWYLLDLQPKIVVREPFTDRLEFWEKINAQLQAFSSSSSEESKRKSVDSDNKSKNQKVEL